MAIYCNTLQGNMQCSDDPYCFTPSTQLSTLKLFIIAYRVSWLRTNYTLTVHVLTLNPLYMVDRDCPISFAKNR